MSSGLKKAVRKAARTGHKQMVTEGRYARGYSDSFVRIKPVQPDSLVERIASVVKPTRVIVEYGDAHSGEVEASKEFSVAEVTEIRKWLDSMDI